MAHGETETPSLATQPPRPLVILEWLLIPVGLAILLVALPHSIVGDDNSRVRMLAFALEKHQILPMKYSLAGPLLAAPLWYLGKLFGNPPGGLLFYDWLLFAGALVAFYFLLRRVWAAEPLRHFLLLMVAGSMFGRHLLHFGAEAFTAILIGVGLAAVGLGRGRWGWIATVVGSVNTPASLLGVGFSALSWAWEKRRVRYLLVPAASVALVAADTWLRLGLHSGYEADAGQRTVMPYSGLPNMSYPMFFGLLGLTLSFGKGLMYFASGLLAAPWLNRLGLPAEVRVVLRLWLWFTAGLVLLYSNWWSWYGGFGAGPRFLLFASFPATLLLAQLLATPSGSWVGSLGRLALLAMSCWTAVATTVFEGGGADVCTANNYANEHLCWFTPEFSVLWNPFVGPFRGVTQGEGVVLGYEALVFGLLCLPLLLQLGRQLRDRVADLAPIQNWRW